MTQVKGRKGQGFTLIELMITVAIIGIIASIAYPSYTRYVIESRRVDAQQALSSFATSMERYRTQNMTYRGAADGGADIGKPAQFPAQTPLDGGGPYYNLTIASAAVSYYELRATPVPSSTQRDSGLLLLRSNGLRGWDKDNSGSVGAGELNWSK